MSTGKGKRPGRFRVWMRIASDLFLPNEAERAEGSKRLRSWRRGLFLPGHALKRLRLAWGRRRRWRDSPQAVNLVLGLPAVAAAAVVFGFTYLAVTTSRGELANRYLREGDARARVQDYRSARVCFEQLVMLDPHDEYRFLLAQSLDALKQRGRALVLMNALAPVDRPGFAPAHLRMARRWMGAQPASLRTYETAEAHLKLALRLDPGSIDAQSLLGQLYAARGRAAEAEPLLTKIATAQPDQMLLLAQVCKARGKPDAANHWANLARDVHRRAAEGDPSDNKARICWAFAEAYFGRFSHAEAILKEGKDGPDEPALRYARSQVYAAWFDALGKGQENGTTDDRMAVLEQALARDPTNPALLERLSTSIEAGGPRADRARASLRAILAGGKATGLVHMILGLDAWGRGKADEAEVHWSQAYRLSPEAPSVANNLARVLAFGSRPDPPRALSIIDHLLERWPDMPEYRDTRGFILVKMKRWNDALPDLEASLRSNFDRPELHQALAEVYTNLHMPEVAGEHRKLAEAARR